MALGILLVPANPLLLPCQTFPLDLRSITLVKRTSSPNVPSISGLTEPSLALPPGCIFSECFHIITLPSYITPMLQGSDAGMASCSLSGIVLTSLSIFRGSWLPRAWITALSIPHPTQPHPSIPKLSRTDTLTEMQTDGSIILRTKVWLLTLSIVLRCAPQAHLCPPRPLSTHCHSLLQPLGAASTQKLTLHLPLSP